MKWRFESPDPRAAYDARSELVAFLRARADGGSDLAAAELIYGELVGNVVRHARGPISVAIEWDDKCAVLTVSDRGPGFRWQGTPTAPDMLRENGRGLFIVSQLSGRFEVEPLPGGGTRARAHLPVSRL